MKQQRNLITEYCFVRPTYLFLNQMNSCDTWLARFDWHQPIPPTLKVHIIY